MSDVADAPTERPAKTKKPKGPAVSKQTKAGLTFAVSRVDKKLRHAKIAKQVAGQASIYLTGVVEHIILKVIEDAGAQAAMKKSKRVNDSHVIAAVRSDPDMARAFGGFCFTSSENVPKAIDRILPEDEQQVRKERKADAIQSKKIVAAQQRADDAADAVED